MKPICTKSSPYWLDKARLCCWRGNLNHYAPLDFSSLVQIRKFTLNPDANYSSLREHRVAQIAVTESDNCIIVSCVWGALPFINEDPPTARLPVEIASFPIETVMQKVKLHNQLRLWKQQTFDSAPTDDIALCSCTRLFSATNLEQNCVLVNFRLSRWHLIWELFTKETAIVGVEKRECSTLPRLSRARGLMISNDRTSVGFKLGRLLNSLHFLLKNSGGTCVWRVGLEVYKNLICRVAISKSQSHA